MWEVERSSYEVGDDEDGEAGISAWTEGREAWRAISRKEETQSDKSR